MNWLSREAERIEKKKAREAKRAAQRARQRKGRR